MAVISQRWETIRPLLLGEYPGLTVDEISAATGIPRGGVAEVVQRIYGDRVRGYYRWPGGDLLRQQENLPRGGFRFRYRVSI